MFVKSYLETIAFSKEFLKKPPSTYLSWQWCSGGSQFSPRSSCESHICSLRACKHFQGIMTFASLLLSKGDSKTYISELFYYHPKEVLKNMVIISNHQEIIQTSHQFEVRCNCVISFTNEIWKKYCVTSGQHITLNFPQLSFPCMRWWNLGQDGPPAACVFELWWWTKLPWKSTLDTLYEQEITFCSINEHFVVSPILIRHIRLKSHDMCMHMPMAPTPHLCDLKQEGIIYCYFTACYSHVCEGVSLLWHPPSRTQADKIMNSHQGV